MRRTDPTPVAALVAQLNEAEKLSDYLERIKATVEAQDAADEASFSLLDRIAETPARTVEDILLKIATYEALCSPQERPLGARLPGSYFRDRYTGEGHAHWLLHGFMHDLRKLAPSLVATIFKRASDMEVSDV